MGFARHVAAHIREMQEIQVLKTKTLAASNRHRANHLCQRALLNLRHSLLNTPSYIIKRVLFTTDYPYGGMVAARRFFDQMPISPNDKEKIGHLNAKRLLGLP
jgi:hypothetical protein